MQSVDSAAGVPLAALYRALWRFAYGARRALALAVALLVGSQLIKLAIPWMAAQAINAIQVDGAAAAHRALGWVAAIFGVSVASWALHGPGRVLERGVGVRVRSSLSDALVGRLLAAPLGWHQARHSGEIQHRVGQATGALFDFAQNQFIYLQNFVNLIGPLAALWLASQFAGGVAIVGYLLIGAVIVGFDGVLMKLAERENQAERRYATAVLDVVGNIATVVALRVQSAARRLHASRLAEVFVPLRRSIVLNEVKWCAVDLMSVALTWGLVIAYAWQTRSAGEALLLGTLFMVYQYAQQAGGVIGALAAHYQNFTRTKVDFASAAPVWDAPQRTHDAAAVPAGWQSLGMRALDYAYTLSDGTTAGVRGASLDLARGERVALVGASGAGKSTLLRVLGGLADAQHGHFTVDGIPQIGLRHLGAVATLVPQEAEVFEASVRWNIAFDDDDARRLDDALHISGFDAVLAALPDGLDTQLSERGFNLSGGQRQRLALARAVHAALAANSSLLLLDEPTSALDPVTEARVLRRIDQAFPGATLVASVHRMNLLGGFDRVVLMDAGRVVDAGGVADLLERQPAFAALYRQQAAEEGEPPPAAVAGG
jgi:ABC-type bacteriocin/lantibiotic exporter with double-glycine peptidase domain